VVSTTRRNTSQRLTLVILVLVSITLVTLDYRGEASRGITSVRNDARDILSPVQRVLSDGFRPIGDFFSGAVNYESAVNENQQLRRQLGALRREVLQNEAAEQQLQAILGQQHRTYVQNLPTLLAEVISGSTSNFEDTFEIDRGTASGVGVGMPVVAGPGLVGIVVSAGSSTSVVQTITDPGVVIGVRLDTPGALPVEAEGQGAGNGLELSGVTATMAPHVGELVYTSGVMGDTLPAGLPVGTVSFVHYSGGSNTKTVQVKPVADLQGVGEVTVLQWFPAP
jgi:rod shape-determining protein MreC